MQRCDPVKSPDFVGGEQLHSKTQKDRTDSFMASWSGYLSLRRPDRMWHWKRWKLFAPAVHMHISSNRHWTLRSRALRIRSARTGWGIIHYTKRHLLPEGGGEKDNSPSFPCWSDATEGRSELSSKYHPDGGRKKESGRWGWGNKRDERGRAHCSTTQIQRKMHLWGELACRSPTLSYN